MRFSTSLLIVSLVSGCGLESVDANAVVVAHVTRSPSNSFESSNMTLRSFKTSDAGRKTELIGVECSGKNALVSFSKVAPPVVIKFPTYLQAERFPNRGKPPPIKISCKYNNRVVSFDLKPTSATRNVRVNTYGAYNAQQGTQSNTSVKYLTSKLSSTLPWRYDSGDVNF